MTKNKLIYWEYAKQVGRNTLAFLSAIIAVSFIAFLILFFTGNLKDQECLTYKQQGYALPTYCREENK